MLLLSLVPVANELDKVSAPPSLATLPTAFASVFESLGGEKRLLDWADENYGDYLKLMIRLIPLGAPLVPPGHALFPVNPLIKRTILDGEKPEDG